MQVLNAFYFVSPSPFCQPQNRSPKLSRGKKSVLPQAINCNHQSPRTEGKKGHHARFIVNHHRSKASINQSSLSHHPSFIRQKKPFIQNASKISDCFFTNCTQSASSVVGVCVVFFPSFSPAQPKPSIADSPSPSSRAILSMSFSA